MRYISDYLQVQYHGVGAFFALSFNATYQVKAIATEVFKANPPSDQNY